MTEKTKETLLSKIARAQSVLKRRANNVNTLKHKWKGD